jgi:hypothetical protein
MTSILTSIKKMLGIEEADTHFDQDIIMHINSVLMILRQMGVGPATGFYIEDKVKTWPDFLGDSTAIEAVKTYVYLKVRLIFDPPSSSFVLESIKEQIQEFEWRLNVQVDVPAPAVTEGGIV